MMRVHIPYLLAVILLTLTGARAAAAEDADSAVTGALLRFVDALEAGDASVLERLMAVLARPYDEQPEHDGLAGRRPEWARNKPGCSALSCSS